MKKYLIGLVLLSLVLSVFVGFNSVSFGQKKYNESPMLAELVKQGKLPPVEERLPKDPYIVGPGELVSEDNYFKVGKYGGTLRLAQGEPNFDPHLFIGNNEPLLWAPSGFDFDKGIRGNILKGFKISGDYKTFTFYLREGLKWSDGYPVTTEDVQFAYEDVLLNDKLTPIFPAWLRDGGRPDGKPMKLEIIDKYTFRIKFTEPYGSFPAMLAISQWRGYTTLLKPKHYLKQFHIKYTPIEKLRLLLKELGYEKDEWWNLFTYKDVDNWEMCRPEAIGFPVLYAWRLVKAEKGVLIYERNPYYFKVDIAGNQLPYIDKIEDVVVPDFQMLMMKGLMGELDYLGERSSMRDLPVIKEKEEAGNYTVVIPKMHRTPTTFYLNLTYNDPVWRRVVRDIRFRRALNLAINRKEMIEKFYLGFASLPKEIPGEYDPKEANRLLDSMGLNKRDSEGWRLGPDGKRFVIPFEVAGHSVEHLPMTELLAEYWKKIGIYTTVKKVEPSLWSQRNAANELKATTLWCHETIWRSLGWDDFLPSNFWGPLWATWMSTQGKAGEEPPPEVKKLYQLWNQAIKIPVGTPQSKKIMDELYSHLRRNVFWFTAAGDSYYPTFFSKKLGNVPAGGKWDGLGISLMYSMEQWYFKE
jgi:peptide/nickel transport system substrate-binding protein